MSVIWLANISIIYTLTQYFPEFALLVKYKDTNCQLKINKHLNYLL